VEQKYKIGDVVVLQTGSLSMTIIGDRLGDDPDSGFCFDGYYRCAWFNEAKVYREIFPQNALKLVARGSE